MSEHARPVGQTPDELDGCTFNCEKLGFCFAEGNFDDQDFKGAKNENGGAGDRWEGGAWAALCSNTEAFAAEHGCPRFIPLKAKIDRRTAEKMEAGKFQPPPHM